MSTTNARATRRDFLQAVIVGGAALKLPWLTGCCGTFPSPAPCDTDFTTLPPGLSAENARLLCLAARAPSGHNSQPWLVRVDSPLRWTLMADMTRALPVIDPVNRELHLSLGAFLENLALAAGVASMHLSISDITADPLAVEVATLSLEPGPLSDYPTERMEQRRTIRGGLSSNAITDADVRMLRDAAGEASLFFARGTEEADYLEAGTRAAFQQQTWNDDAQAELAKWTRLSDADGLSTRDGLTPVMMDIPGLAGCFTRVFGADVLGAQWREGGIAKTAEQVQQGAGWFVMSTAAADIAELLESGRRFQRMWLVAQSLEIGLHPMSQALEEAPWRDEVASMLNVAGQVQWVMRLGYVAPYPTPDSLRRPVEQFATAP